MSDDYPINEQLKDAQQWLFGYTDDLGHPIKGCIEELEIAKNCVIYQQRHVDGQYQALSKLLHNQRIRYQGQYYRVQAVSPNWTAWCFSDTREQIRIPIKDIEAIIETETPHES